jgi:radical SAM C-methyltransferase
MAHHPSLTFATGCRGPTLRPVQVVVRPWEPEGPAARPLTVTIVQQGAWASPLPTMPLAAGYLKAAADADPRLRSQVDITIENLRGGLDVRSAAVHLLGGRVPDVLAFSVLGWNQRSFVELARTFKQLRPDGLVVFGGNHVSHQGDEVLHEHPQVDIIVNGEGETTFREILAWRQRGADLDELEAIEGVSFRDPDGQVVTTPDRPRCAELGSLPSPLLTGAIPLLDETGAFPYDVALLETNRGCPYRCSFCYWGGAVGARVHEFPRDRLRAELELLGSHGVETVVLCDANFGMRRADLHFVEDLLAVRAIHGAPRYLEASWTKNKAETFYEIVRLMKREGLMSSFTLALQSMDGPTLEGMARRNMQINDWHEVVDVLAAEGLECYGELIWGAPGESPATFFAGYDELARRVPRIAVYPLLIIPNTDYDARRDEHGIITVRGHDDDFDYVLAHDQMTAEENIEAQEVIFWARVLAENSFLRGCWIALRLAPEIGQSAAIRRFSERLARSETPVATMLRSHFRPFADSAAVAGALRDLHAHRDASRALFDDWWEHDVVAHAPSSYAEFLRCVLQHDWLTLPIYVDPAEDPPHPVIEVDGERHYQLPPATLPFDVPGELAAITAGCHPGWVPERRTTELHLRAKVGFHDHVENHEVAIHYVGTPTPG